MPLSPPFPVSAVKRPGVPVIDVTFDQPLLDGPVFVDNWTGRDDNRLWEALGPPIVAGSVVTIDFTLTLPNPGPPIVNYAATPPDVVSFPGLVPAAAFADFPVA